MTLYEIDQAILETIDQETGEILDVERLNALQMDRQAKLENVALWVKNLEADAAAITEEMGRLAERKKAMERKGERLREWLMGALGGEKLETARCCISYRRSKAVEIGDEERFRDWALMNGRDDLLTFSDPKPSKTNIKKALADGEQIPGVMLAERQNMTIR